MKAKIKKAPKNKWDQAILDAAKLLSQVEARAARLRGAIKTFAELRDADVPFEKEYKVEDI